MVLIEDMLIKSIEALDSNGNQRCDDQDDHGVIDLEDGREPFRPADPRAAGADNSLSENEVDDEQKRDPSLHKNLGGDGELQVPLLGCPTDS